MLERWSHAVVRRRGLVIGCCLVTALAAALYGRGLFTRLGYSVFYDPAAPSTEAARLARTQLGEGDPDVVALYRLPDGVADEAGADSPEVRARLASLMARVGEAPEVTRVVGPSGPLAQRFVSADRRSTFVVVSLSGTPRSKIAALERLRPLLALPLPPSTVTPELGGLVPSGRSLTRLAQRSLAHGERIALPVTALLLLVIFGSVVAALLPLAIGGLSVVLAVAALALLSHVITVDVFAVNVVTILGLGVAIDYALFLITRHREELALRSEDPARAPLAVRRQALARAVATAGRSVLYSGLTVAASLGGLLVFRQPFLRSVAVGGMVVTLIADVLALAVLPAVIDLLGPRLERGRLRRVRSLCPACPEAPGVWGRIARRAIRHRVLVCVTATAALVMLALPFRRLQPSRADVRALPPDEEPRRVSGALERDFPATVLQPDSILVELDGDALDGDRLGQLWDYTTRLRSLPGVVRVDSLLSFAGVQDRDGAEELAERLRPHVARARLGAHGQPGLGAILSGRYTLVRVVPSAPPDSRDGQELVAALRALAPPDGSRARVFGQAAALYDFASGLRARAPYMIAVVLTAMFVLLSSAFRSAVLPLKATLMTTLSLTASFGAAVYVFQDGRLEHLLGFQHLGTTDATLPVVMFAVVFGLSMDYEVLILSRIREAWLRTGDNAAAIVEGLGATGRLVTSAALVMVVVFSAFAVAPVVFVEALGVGMALAVALDATVVRMLLVPSTMALLGRLNWWMPRLQPRPRRRHRSPATA